MTPAVIILNWNNFDDTDECLSSLYKADLCGGFIVLVDNGSQDGLYEKLREKWSYWKAIHWIKNKENLGFAGGNNVGIRYALSKGAEYVMLLNNDTVVAPNFLEGLIKFLSKHTNVGIVAPKIFYYSKPNIFQTVGDKIDLWTGRFGPIGEGEQDIGQYNKPMERDYVTGAAIMISRNCLKKIGLLDEAFFSYVEEVDWCLRAKKAGFRVMYVPYSKVWHKVSRSICNLNDGNSFQLYYTFRNKIIFMRKHARFFHWFGFLPLHLYRALKTITRPGTFKIIIKGIIEGFTVPINQGTKL